MIDVWYLDDVWYLSQLPNLVFFVNMCHKIAGLNSNSQLSQFVSTSLEPKKKGPPCIHLQSTTSPPTGWSELMEKGMVPRNSLEIPSYWGNTSTIGGFFQLTKCEENKDIYDLWFSDKGWRFGKMLHNRRCQVFDSVFPAKIGLFTNSQPKGCFLSTKTPLRVDTLSLGLLRDCD